MYRYLFFIFLIYGMTIFFNYMVGEIGTEITTFCIFWKTCSYFKSIIVNLKFKKYSDIMF